MIRFVMISGPVRSNTNSRRKVNDLLPIISKLRLGWNRRYRYTALVLLILTGSGFTRYIGDVDGRLTFIRRGRVLG